MGLDLGSKFTGIAVTDEYQSIGRALGVMATPEPMMIRHNLIEFLQSKGIKMGNLAGYVIGNPINLDGSQSSQSRIFQEYINQCQKIGNMDWGAILMVDERYTSSSAFSNFENTYHMKNEIVLRKNRRKNWVSKELRSRSAGGRGSKDSNAALEILNTYLRIKMRFS